MTTKLKRMRESQGIEVSFVAGILGMDIESYKIIEQNDFSELEIAVQDEIAQIFGVEKDYILRKNFVKSIPGGFARSYTTISDKDKKEINKLLNLKKMYMEEICG